MDIETPSPSNTITDEQAAILDLERYWWKYAGAKEQAIRQRLGISSTVYYQRLNALIDQPGALAADPQLVNRLQRLRAARQRQRSAARLPYGGGAR